MSSCHPEPAKALQGDPRARAASGQAAKPGSPPEAVNKFITAPDQAQRENCNTYSPPGYAYTAEAAG